MWLQYRKKGLWGLWAEYWGANGWLVEIAFAGKAFRLDAMPGYAEKIPNSYSQVISWRVPAGLELSLYAERPVPPELAESWRSLFHYESAKWDARPTFFPAPLPLSSWSKELAARIFSPSGVILFNGSPGTGKRTLLYYLALLHCRCLPDLVWGDDNFWHDGARQVWIVPELAVLEPEEQHAIFTSVAAGAKLWAASAYDLGVLHARGILKENLLELVLPARMHLPVVAGRSKEEIEGLAEFWRSFYGEVAAAGANLEFLKRRAIFGAQLPVGEILEEGRGLRGIVAELEKEAIRQAYARVGRSQHRIARLLKVSRGSLQHKLRKYRMERIVEGE